MKRVCEPISSVALANRVIEEHSKAR
jgi:hypothetical protein